MGSGILGRRLLEDLRALCESLLDVLYPARPVCPLCSQPFSAVGFQVLCLDCFEALSPRERWQPVACHPGEPLGPTAALGLYQGLWRRAVHLMKFRAHRRLALALGYLMGALALDHAPSRQVDAVVPVPLHPQRAWQRGFNQASLLATGVARVLYRPIWDGVVARTRVTRQQAGLQQRQRLVNVEGAFSVVHPERVQGRRVLLVDDVMTTGATLQSAARSLVEAGAEQVLALVVAEAPIRARPEGDRSLEEEALWKAKEVAGLRASFPGGRLAGGVAGS